MVVRSFLQASRAAVPYRNRIAFVTVLATRPTGAPREEVTLLTEYRKDCALITAFLRDTIEHVHAPTSTRLLLGRCRDFISLLALALMSSYCTVRTYNATARKNWLPGNGLSCVQCNRDAAGRVHQAPAWGDYDADGGMDTMGRPPQRNGSAPAICSMLEQIQAYGGTRRRQSLVVCRYEHVLTLASQKVR